MHHSCAEKAQLRANRPILHRVVPNRVEDTTMSWDIARVVRECSTDEWGKVHVAFLVGVRGAVALWVPIAETHARLANDGH